MPRALPAAPSNTRFDGDKRAMFIRNCWYVVAWDHEIPAEGLFARTVIGEPLLLFRTAGGDVVALEDRCCHRLARCPRGGAKATACAAATTA
jgi:phenylpropionate dioxygenase-like ring-hydroxylating dioxygenase large terminal subunit